MLVSMVVVRHCNLGVVVPPPTLLPTSNDTENDEDTLRGGKQDTQVFFVFCLE